MSNAPSNKMEAFLVKIKWRCCLFAMLTPIHTTYDIKGAKRIHHSAAVMFCIISKKSDNVINIKNKISTDMQLALIKFNQI